MAEEEYQVWLDAVCGPGVSLEESQKAYEDWASTYDQDAVKYQYDINSIKIGSVLQDLFQESERGNVRILDVAAGTGLVAKELKRCGFKHIDALDPSIVMLNEAKKNNLYENYFVEFITGTPSSLPANSYDILTGGGIYGIEAHMPTEALYEMIRLVKPGGIILLVGNYTLIQASKNYNDLEPLMQRLEAEGKWKKLIHEIWTAHAVQMGISGSRVTVLAGTEALEGIILLVGSFTLIQSSKNYKDLIPLMQRLEAVGKWKKLIHEIWTAQVVGGLMFERITSCYRVL